MSEPRQVPSAHRDYHTSPLETSEVSGYMPQGKYVRRDADEVVVRHESRLKVPTREVVCYECGKPCLIPDAALSTICPHCSSHLNAADVTVRPGTRHLDVRTLGDVRIPAGVELSQLRVACRHLTLEGRVSGSLYSTGTLTLQGQALAAGKLNVARLVVRSRAHACVRPGISCIDAELHGELVGGIHARGVVHILSGGRLIGECCSAGMRIDPGGKHEGTRKEYKAD